MHRIGGTWIAAACVLAVVLVAVFGMVAGNAAQAGQKTFESEYRVLEPFQSGALTLFPVVHREDASAAKKWDYITLDAGLRGGEVEVTEYGKTRGMVRPPRKHIQPVEGYRGDRVNTLVLINNSDRPLLLLAGEIVTGGKQDRVIGKDRIVPAHSDPIDLSVFCIEHGRWVESSDKFGIAGNANGGSFMVQPSVRSQAMVKEDQQQVWDSVHRSVTTAGVAARAPMATTSYAKAMSDDRVVKQVDSVVEPLTRSSHEVQQKLRDAHAVGVVVAVHGEIIWADIFASPDMLSAYWTKLVRSYAAESMDDIRAGSKQATIAAAQHFVDRPAHGTESSEGETGVYRYREVRGDDQSSFYLQVLLPGTDFYAHMSRIAEEGDTARLRPVPVMVR